MRRFTETEFLRASRRAPTFAGKERIGWWGGVLDPVREFAGVLIITSWIRHSRKGFTHGPEGEWIDVQPADGDDARIREVADFAAALYRPGRTGSPLAQIIYEAPEPGQNRAHIHLARICVRGATPGYLLDLEGDRTYIRAPLPTIRVVR